MTDLKSLSDEDLVLLSEDVSRELGLREALMTAENTINRVSSQYIEARDRAETEVGGTPAWVPPTGAVGVYPAGYTVVHKGKTWVSLTPNNVWEPGSSGWRQVPIGDEAPPGYVPPTGAHDAYQSGERITWEDGLVYEATRDGVVHSPAEDPDSWRQVTDEGEPADDDQPEDPQEPSEAEAWAAGVSYAIGDKVTHGAQTYVCIQPHTSEEGWEPPAAPALWSLDNVDDEQPPV